MNTRTITQTDAEELYAIAREACTLQMPGDEEVWPTAQGYYSHSLYDAVEIALQNLEKPWQLTQAAFDTAAALVVWLCATHLNSPLCADLSPNAALACAYAVKADVWRRAAATRREERENP